MGIISRFFAIIIGVVFFIFSSAYDSFAAERTIRAKVPAIT
jgi:hypothetical protein